MSFWIFKVAEQELYPDEMGVKYVFDNTHSVRVRAGDEFLYLDKKAGYSFTGSGVVARLVTRRPTENEKQRTRKVRLSASPRSVSSPGERCVTRMSALPEIYGCSQP